MRWEIINCLFWLDHSADFGQIFANHKTTVTAIVNFILKRINTEAKQPRTCQRGKYKAANPWGWPILRFYPRYSYFLAFTTFYLNWVISKTCITRYFFIWILVIWIKSLFTNKKTKHLLASYLYFQIGLGIFIQSISLLPWWTQPMDRKRSRPCRICSQCYKWSHSRYHGPGSLFACRKYAMGYRYGRR